jgi:hypothetical protein
MKKIMFNDRYGLTEAVLTGRKTMTRRIIGQDVELEWARRGKVHIPISWYKHRMLWMDCTGLLPGSGKFDYVAPQKYQPAYDWDEEVAVAQSYQTIHTEMMEGNYLDDRYDAMRCYLGMPCEEAGWTNKMFVRADLMPHRIRITNIKAERLQDISDEDCLKEGITRKASPLDGGWNYYVKGLPPKRKRNGNATDFAVSADGTAAIFATPRGAFSALIDRISGRGTWQRNPWVVAYEFELINKEN